MSSNEELKIINEILKRRGLDLISAEEDPIEFVSFGVSELDILVEENNNSGYPGGGLPRNRITEIYGRKGVGKTTLMSFIIPRFVGKVLYIDVENAISRVLPDNVVVVRTFILEHIQGIVNDALESGGFDIIVVDSIAAATTQQEIDADEGMAQMGMKAKVMSQWMRTINKYLKDSGTAVVMINQERDTLNPFGIKSFTPGGKALPYAATLRIELSSWAKDRILKDGKQVGHKVHAKLEKNRLGAERAETIFKLMYDVYTDKSK